jgi:hypothetical protein
VAGAGGVILSRGENKDLSFHWNIGITTNNQVKVYVMLYNLLLAKTRGIPSLSIIGDFKFTINDVKLISQPFNRCLKAIFQQI